MSKVIYNLYGLTSPVPTKAILRLVAFGLVVCVVGCEPAREQTEEEKALAEWESARLADLEWANEKRGRTQDRPNDEWQWTISSTPLAELQQKAKQAALKRNELKFTASAPGKHAIFVEAKESINKEEHKKAEELLLALAEEGYVDAEFELYHFYIPWHEPSDFSHQNAEKALYWLDKCLAKGYAKAQYAYSYLHTKPSHSVKPVHFGTAFDWAYIAAEQGYTRAKIAIAMSYFDGRGIERDLVESYKWLELTINRPLDVAENDPNYAISRKPFAQSLQQQIATDNNMPPQKIAEAKRLAKEWELAHPYAYKSVDEVGY
ncbi:tetratricopeptide repeat protein [Saccharophagus degradans]|uniref:Serine/threonine protein kinase n=1 Tax=Saccharophagus degradans (strain 2-40 / ATCC 43961 / DSM 17024) TaxID=203122 RepID=Q21GY0_SACD2|nr:sel1 repeat family protein [Saccharophagus degradans]ABD82049.1 serine/threonine protein kinase [Saccharophagus degradans 2-40]